MSEFGTPYNGLQGFAYSATAIINALAELNNTLSSLSISNPLQRVSFSDNGEIVTNTSSSTMTHTFSSSSSSSSSFACRNHIGFILQAKDTNTSNVLLNGGIELKPGTTFVLTVEQNRIFNISSVTVTIAPGDSVAWLPICVS